MTFTIKSEPFTNAEDSWAQRYLACLASTPRNRVEWELEKNTRPANQGVEIMDTFPKPANYPTGDIKLWWVALVLDGHPDMRRAHQDTMHVIDKARMFRNTVQLKMREMSTQPYAQVLGDFVDGCIFAYDCEHPYTPLQLCIQIADCLVARNRDEPNWIWQTHLRAGIGSTVGQMFAGLLQTTRSQTRIVQSWGPEKDIIIRLPS